jgi:hypothetical protein
VLLRTPDQTISQLLPQPLAGGLETGRSQPVAADNIETLRKKAETLTHLYELSQVLSSVFSLTEVFKRVSQMLFRLTPSDRFVVVLKDSQTGELSPLSQNWDPYAASWRKDLDWGNRARLRAVRKVCFPGCPDR